MKTDVSEIIDRSRVGPFHWALIAITGFVTINDGFDLVSMGMVVPSLSAEWGLEPAAFSTALSAALVGVLFGSATAGTMGDYIGRRWTLIFMLLVTVVFMSLTATVSSMNQLIAYRFLTGFGAGGSIPVAIAFTSEFMPAKRRNMLVALMYSGAALGSVIAGAVGPTVIARYDWHGIFLVGGALSLIGVFLVFFGLPESLRFIVAKRSDHARASALIERLAPDYEFSEGEEFIVKEHTHDGSPARELFTDGQTPITLTIWLIFFANQFMIFFIGLWLPTVFVESGLALQSALYLLAINNLGAVFGGPALGYFADRVTAQKVLLITYPLAALGIATIGFLLGGGWLLFVVTFFAGAMGIGSSLCLGALTASLYPTRARATGVGWALSIGRAGSIIAPLAGGVVLGWGAQGFFLAAAVAPLLCAVGIFILIPLTRPRETT